MNLTFVLPTAAALLTAAAVGLAAGHLTPAVATRLLASAALTATVAVVAAILAISVAYLAQLPRLAEAIGWCQAVVSHHDRVPPEAGIPAVLALVWMGFAAQRVVRRRRRAQRAAGSHEGVEILPSDQAVAYAVPGRPGHVVVSVGMIRRLDPDERRVVLAHEQAHLTLHHHRFLVVTEVASAVLPPLRLLHRRLRFSTERWADETAAREVGDRRLVARAIAAAALASHPPGAAMAVNGGGVVERVEALLVDRRPAPWLAVGLAAAVAGVLVASAAGSGIQLHHLATLIDQLCN